jgi:hypothetical protein
MDAVMVKKPDYKDASWDATCWSLWGLLYTGATSDHALKTAISDKFGQTRAQLKRIGPQVDPLASTVANWKAELGSYARTIKFGEAQGILDRLQILFTEISQQACRDEQLVESGKKPARRESSAARAAAPAAVDDYEDEDEAASDEDLAWAKQWQNTVMGHSAATAKVPPRQAAKPYVPPTAEEVWRDEQRAMAARCDNGIDFGAHEVNQDSVLRRLGLDADDGGVRQYRVGPENSHERIMLSRKGRQLWTLGLTHQARRDAGDFSVYRRIDCKSRFEHVSGRRHPKDPGP